MEHIIVTPLDNGFVSLTPEPGYILYNDNIQSAVSEAVVKSTAGFRAVLSGIEPQPHERTLSDAKKEKLAALNAFDQGPEVLSFSFGGHSMWLNPQQRTNYLMTLDAAEEVGLTTVPFNGQQVSISDARAILKAVALYAMQTMATTDAHAAAIRSLQTIEAVDAYDFTVGYPEKLTF